MTRRLALVAVLSLLAGAALAVVSVAAAHAYTSEQLQRWHAVADQVWTSSHCAGRYQPNVVEHLTAGPMNTEAVGSAHIADPACEYNIVRGLDDYDACVVVVHEAGHLAGYRSTNPAVDARGHLDYAHDRHASVMNTVVLDVIGTFRPCQESVPPTLRRAAAINWVEARWGEHLQSLDCRRHRLVSRQRCWGRTAAGKRARWVVWRDGQHRVRGGRLS